jgi:large subunit ribosomal protein L28
VLGGRSNPLVAFCVRDRAWTSIQANSSEEKERVMAAVCEVCNKRPSWGMSVSHSHVRTKRRWSPNIQRVRAMINGTPKRLYVCTSCIRAGKVTKVSRGTAASDK